MLGVSETLHTAVTHPALAHAMVRPQRPFVVTSRVVRLWEQMLLPMHVNNEHVLVVGPIGCGKSDAVRALACLLQLTLEHV